MNRRQFIQTTSFLLISKKLAPLYAQMASTENSRQWMSEFGNPPDAVHPWVYAFWMGGNITKEGITADLEGMHQAGIRGMLFMDGALGNPLGPHRFMSESWSKMFDHLLAEADRLGIELNLNNDPGWSGSSGPWVKPEQATQKVIVSEMVLEGPSHFGVLLPIPSGVNHGYYRDIAVLAYPAPAGGNAPTYRIPDFNSTKSFAGGHDFAGVVPWPRFIPTNPEWPMVSADQCLQAAKMLDLTGKMKENGKLTWDVPPGRWIVFRFGHTVGNGGARSAQLEAQGLECDKLSKSALDAHFSAMVGKLIERTGTLNGKTLVSIHIDSWEAGSGNWTDGFRDEFLRRREYDLQAFLPVLNGIVVDSREVSERFLWDYRETVSELVLENYAGHMRELAHRNGLRLSIEAYDGTCDDLRYAGRADEPMSEFWRSCYSGLPLSDLCESMTSAAHVYGKRIIGAEAFTATRGDFLDHPATLKPLADWAFCTGINRLCFSEWVMQPWPHLIPGVSFSTFGTVFHRSLTWWPLSKPWHEYIARCQYMLRQGQFVADICFVAPEGAPYRFTPPIPAAIRGGIPDRPEYNFDGCPAELVIGQMTVEGNKVVLPSGMKYQLLVLPTYSTPDQPVMDLMVQDDYFYKPEIMPRVQTMTPTLLRKIKNLIEEGAIVLGYRPLKSPSLTDFPQCDEDVVRLADNIWGRNAGRTGYGETRVGKGRVIWGKTPEQVLSEMGVQPDFTCDQNLKGRVNYTHRRAEDDSDIYFAVNKQTSFLDGVGHFRTVGKQPELYWPQTGRIEPVLAFEEKNGVTSMPLSLNAHESVFVVFREPSRKSDHVISVTRDEKALWPKPIADAGSEETEDSFMMAAWITPGPDLVLPKEQDDRWIYAHSGVQTPGLGYQTMTSPGQGRGGFVIGRNGVIVYQYGGSGEIEPLLVYEGTITEPTHVGVLYKKKIPQLFLNGKLVKTGPENRFPQQSSSGWADRRPFAGEIAALQQFDDMLAAAGIEGLDSGLRKWKPYPAFDFLHRCIWKSGTYAFKDSNGKSRKLTVHLSPAEEIVGPWQVEFDPKWGGPGSINFENLKSWSDHIEDGVRYYSGTATYRKIFKFDQPEVWTPNSRIHLDLGKVASLGDVTLNGQHLGIVWNSPYRVDVTHAIKSGPNTLEVQVANVWVNRLIGDEHLPEDSDRAPDGQLLKWPGWVLEGKKSPTGRFTFTTYRQWSKDNPLIQSGLLGPVRLLMSENI